MDKVAVNVDPCVEQRTPSGHGNEAEERVNLRTSLLDGQEPDQNHGYGEEHGDHEETVEDQPG